MKSTMEHVFFFFVSDHILSETVIIFSTMFHSKKLNSARNFTLHVFLWQYAKDNLLNFFENKPTLSKYDI